MKIVVTGAAGLVGLNLLHRLHGHDVVAIDADEKRLAIIREQHPHVTAVHADLAKRGAWESHWKGAGVVIALQAQISAPTREPYVRNNVRATENVLAACKKYKTKHLIHLSSSVVISVSDDLYVQTKREGEELVKASGVPYTILRPPLMYGCYDYKHMSYLTSFIEKTPIVPTPGTGRFIRQPLYVNDLCAVIVKCVARKPTSDVHDIISSEQVRFLDMLKIIAQERKLKRVFVPIPLWMLVLLVRLYRFVNPRSPYVVEQLYALTAGDVFAASDWEKRFSVKRTPYRAGVRQMVRDPNYRYRAGHQGA